MAVNPSAIVARADRLLTTMENAQIAQITRFLRRAQADLERDLKALYMRAQLEGRTESIAWRQTRARMLLEDVNKSIARLDPSASRSVNSALRTVVADARKIGNESALEFMSAFGPTGNARNLISMGVVDISLESVANAVKNSAARLYRYSAEAQLKINDIVLSGLSRGQGWAKTANELRANTGLLHYQAERIVRTESLSNNDNARRETYAENGVEYVQRLATQDTRVCEYCADRAGKVYRVDQAPAALHPNDRCYNLPWTPEWHELGLTNEEYYLEHRKDVIARLATQDKKPKRGKAPFERMNDLETPKPVWAPGQGFTAFGRSQGLGSR